MSQIRAVAGGLDAKRPQRQTCGFGLGAQRVRSFMSHIEFDGGDCCVSHKFMYIDSLKRLGTGLARNAATLGHLLPPDV